MHFIREPTLTVKQPLVHPVERLFCIFIFAFGSFARFNKVRLTVLLHRRGCGIFFFPFFFWAVAGLVPCHDYEETGVLGVVTFCFENKLMRELETGIRIIAI